MSSSPQPVIEPVSGGSAEVAPPIAANEPAPRPRSRIRRAFAWLGRVLWLSDAVRAQRTELALASDAQRALLQHARASAESGDRAFDPIDPLRSGPGFGVAAVLYAESIRAALALPSGTGEPGALTDLPPGELREQLLSACGGEPELLRVAELARHGAIEELIANGKRLTRDQVRPLRAVAHALVERALAPERRLRRLFVQRFARMSAALILLALLVVVPIFAVNSLTDRPDLSVGKPWRASSTYAGFSPAKAECDGKKTAIFFHTNEEENPWLEYDLGQPTTIERVRVVNRTDCCPDRAIPLVIEVSADAQNWVEVSRRAESFERWGAKFSPTTARYVRLRALKRTWLHFESVSIH